MSLLCFDACISDLILINFGIEIDRTLNTVIEYVFCIKLEGMEPSLHSFKFVLERSRDDALPGLREPFKRDSPLFKEQGGIVVSKGLTLTSAPL